MSGVLAKLRDDRGSILVFVAVAVPTLIAAFAIVVDVGNAFIHQRSLQNEVDAAALAGGDVWGSCFNGAGKAAMFTEATKYDGLGAYNPQAGHSGTYKGALAMAFNSTTYPGTPPTGAAPDDTTPDPCVPTGGKYMFDVKGTESGLPLLLHGLLPGVPGPSLHARARVELRQITSLNGILPLGVPDVRPNFVFAQFVNEDDAAKTPLTGWIELTKSGTAGGNQYWSAPAAAVPIPAGGANVNVGVRLRLVGSNDKNAACGQVLVDCYDNSPSTSAANGLVHIRGFASGAAAPRAANAWLLAGTCAPDAYFAAATCSAGVQAEVDLGATHPLTGAGVTATVSAAVDGGSPVALTKGTTTGSLTTWSLAQGLGFGSSGPHTVDLSWTWEQTSGTWSGKTCTNKKSNPCTDSGDFGVVQRGFVSDATRSGPVQSVQIGQPSAGTTAGANSFAQGSNPSLTVTVGTTGSFEVQAATPGAPIVNLRVAGSQNGSIDCDPAIANLDQEIVSGCAPGYITDDNGAPCPSYNTLWSTAQPWYCAKVQTGNASGQVDHGLDQRIQGGSGGCRDDNAWPTYPLTDPRIVPLFLTPFGSFSGTGNTTVPVIGFGAFYITGYHGDPCPHATPSVASGSISGHFITYIVQDPGAQPSQKSCDTSSLVPCIPVLVK